jgi:hypothetical protein
MGGNEIDGRTLEIMYNEILDQWRGSFRTYQTIRERIGQIIAFIGIILNLELLGILQIFSSKIPLHYMEILILSSLFIIISLLMAAFAYRTAPFQNLTSTVCLDDKFINKTRIELLKIICEDRIEDIKLNKKIIHQRATWAHVSLYNLVIGIILVAIFIILNLSSDNYLKITFLLLVIGITILFYVIEHTNFSKILKSKK